MLSFLPARLRKENGVITISNLFTRYLAADLRRAFKTTRIGNYMFTELGTNSLQFHEFFALEFYHVLDELLHYPHIYTSVRKIKEIQQLLLDQTWIGATAKTHPSKMNMSKLSLFRLTPLDYQEAFFKAYDQTTQAYNLNGMLLAAAPGTGKTFTSLATAECLEAEVIVIFCQKNSIDTVWLESINGEKSVYHKKPTVWSTLDWQPYKGQHIMVFHYEGLQHAMSMAFQLAGKKIAVILDESQNLNEMKSLRTERYLDFCAAVDAKDIIHSTGTPIKALAVETVPLLRAIDPLFTEEVQKMFVKLYAGEASRLTEVLSRRLNIISYKVEKKVLKLQEPITTGVKVKIPHGEKYTLEAIGQDMIAYAQKRRAELTKQLPEITKVYEQAVLYAETSLTGSASLPKEVRDDIKVQFQTYRQNVLRIQKAYKARNLAAAKEEMPAANRFEREMIIPALKTAEERQRFKDYKSVVKYMDLKIKGECLGRILGQKRIEAFSATVEHIPFEDITESTEKKTIVFTTYIDVVLHVQKILKRQGYSPLVVYGEHISELATIVKKFEDDQSSNPLITTYASLSTAVPLTMADTLIIVNPPYRDYILQQTIARVHRLGANSQIRIFNIELDTGEKPNISSRNIDIIEWSRKQANAVLSLNTDMEEDSSIALEQMFENHDAVRHDPQFSMLPGIASW